MVQSVIASEGGVAKFAEIPFAKEFASGQARQRSLDHFGKQLAGAKTVAQKNAITATWKPITLGMAKRGGTWKAGIEDGRHGLAAAKAGGATKIRAEVTVSTRRGHEKTITTMVKI